MNAPVPCERRSARRYSGSNHFLYARGWGYRLRAYFSMCHTPEKHRDLMMRYSHDCVILRERSLRPKDLFVAERRFFARRVRLAQNDTIKWWLAHFVTLR